MGAVDRGMRSTNRETSVLPPPGEALWKQPRHPLVPRTARASPRSRPTSWPASGRPVHNLRSLSRRIPGPSPLCGSTRGAHRWGSSSWCAALTPSPPDTRSTYQRRSGARQPPRCATTAWETFSVQPPSPKSQIPQPTLLDWEQWYENSRVWSSVFHRRGFVCFSTAAHHAK